ncbi:MAG: PEP-CTERM sorting domain-containing protein [Nitrospirota bacterium]|nr:PEP-CTERM sorting domain-containing protein [Nitrospirota bacterium]
MRKTNKMKNITVAMGLALAMVVGSGINAKPALATAGYLSDPTLSTSGGAFQVQVNGSYNMYATGTSTYGNTIPTPSQILATPGYAGPSTITTVADGVNGTNATVPTYYDPSTLDLKLVATMTDPYSQTVGGVTETGNVLSNVFRIGSTASMPGAVPGELVFTYQYNVTGVSSLNNVGLGQASISFFNNPNGTAYTLGAGINYNSSTGTLEEVGPYLPGTLISLTAGNLSGTVGFANNGTVSTLTYNSNSSVLVGEVSPQFFVASNAFYYTTGQIGLTGSGLTAYGSVFVPDSPEPATLFLFGTGIAFLAFMTLRKKANTLAI